MTRRDPDEGHYGTILGDPAPHAHPDYAAMVDARLAELRMKDAMVDALYGPRRRRGRFLTPAGWWLLVCAGIWVAVALACAR